MKLVLTLGLLLATPGCEDKPQRHPPNVPPLPSQGVPAVLVDINHASRMELESLPGVGEVYARRIIEGRPYAEKTQLRSRDILPEGTYDKVRDYIIARQH